MPSRASGSPLGGAGPALLVFVRAPRRGGVKTRLAAEIGEAAALRVYRRLAEHTMREARGSGAAVRVHVTPDAAVGEAAAWLGPADAYLPQREGTLGERLSRAFRSAFAAGHGPVVVVGSDLPGLTARLLQGALRSLDRSPAVLGPAADGGYYLLGLRAPCPHAFEDIPWSTSGVLRATLQRLESAGIPPALLPTLRDVDRADDLPAGW
jgi:uncharacterized protein